MLPLECEQANVDDERHTKGVHKNVIKFSPPNQIVAPFSSVKRKKAIRVFENEENDEHFWNVSVA